jgi:hypothetical protein
LVDKAFMATLAQHGDGMAAACSDRKYEPYADPDRPGVARVPVRTRKHKGMEAIIDVCDLPLVRGFRLNWSPGSNGRGMSGGSLALVMNGSPKPLARIIMNVTDPDLQVSHVNGDRLDCRRGNLQVRTRSQVALARKPSPQTLSRLAPYPDPDRPGVWRVPLKSHIAEREVLIDEADLPIVQGRNWNWSTRSDDGRHAGRTEGVVVLATTGTQLPLHRMIMNVTDARTRVWFINGDALDCRRSNLTVLTLAETAQHSAKMSTRAGKTCTSPFKGICRDGPRGKWLAQIRKGRVSLHVGRFDSEIEAARAYDAAARVLFGEHAHLNLPDQPSTEQALADARRIMDSASNRVRAQRRRQRDIERELRGAAPDAMELEQMARDQCTMISGETARQLFDVTPTVWQRWHRFGWLPAGATADDGQAMYQLTRIERLLRRCDIVALPYLDPQRPGVYRVPLSGETGAGREALIDADAVPLVQTRRWRFAPSDVGRGGEVQTMIPSENIRLHYVVMGITSDGECHIGHRNDDPLDCRRANLVVRTQSDTHANHRKQATFCGRPCTSRFKGVYREKRSGRWVATIKKDRVQRRLGSFRDEIAAAQAYDEAARKLFGEHARLNFPDGVDTWLEREALHREILEREAA